MQKCTMTLFKTASSVGVMEHHTVATMLAIAFIILISVYMDLMQNWIKIHKI